MFARPHAVAARENARFVIKKMSTVTAKLLVLVGKYFACVKNIGPRQFLVQIPDFKVLLAGLAQKGYGHFIIDLSECVLMDSTFLGVLAGFGLKI